MKRFGRKIRSICTVQRIQSFVFIFMAVLILSNEGIVVAQSQDVGPDDALTLEDLRSVEKQYAWFNLHAGGCSGTDGSVTASGPAADLLTKAGLDPKWVNLIVADAAVAKTDPIAMAALLFWEHRGFPEYKNDPSGTDSGGRGPWQMTAGSWPKSAGDYHSNVGDPIVSTKVAAAMVHSYGGEIGIAGGSIQQDFGKNAHIKSVATLAKNYNAGPATYRVPGVSDWNAGGRDWQYGGGTSWGGTKNRIIDDYVVAMTYAYYQMASGTAKPPKSADTNKYVAEGRAHINDIKNFKWNPTGGGSGDSGGTGGTPAPSSGDGKPVIVLDPGHAKDANMTKDPATGIGVSDYSNLPGHEMKDTWNVANEAKKQLDAAGYEVFLTKTSEDGLDGGKPNTNLKQRADVGTQHKAALGISIHTTPGKVGNGQEMNFIPLANKDYVTGNKRYTYTNEDLAKKDLEYAKIFQKTRAAALNIGTDKVKVGGYNALTGNIGSISKGTMLTTQYFATVPWMYFEQAQDGPNESLTAKSYNAYVKGIVDGVKQAIPSSGTSGGGCSDGDTAGGGATGNAMADLAIKLAWPNQNHGGKYCSDAKPGDVGTGYEATMRKYNNQHGYDECSDCGVFVATVVRASGADPNYQGRGTGSQEDYMQKHPDKWQRINTTSTGDLRPGDILVTPVHTFMFTGAPGDKYKARSASLGGHTPWASNVQWHDIHGNLFHVYRKK